MRPRKIVETSLTEKPIIAFLREGRHGPNLSLSSRGSCTQPRRGRCIKYSSTPSASASSLFLFYCLTVEVFEASRQILPFPLLDVLSDLSASASGFLQRGKNVYIHIKTKRARSHAEQMVHATFHTQNKY